MNRALIVIDVQNEYMSGKLPIEYPDVGTSLANIGAAIEAAHRHQVPVVLVQNTAPRGSPAFDKGSHGWQLHDMVACRKHDHYVEKFLPSAFAGTDLMDWVRAHGIDTVTLVGYMTHNCIASTAIAALHAGLAVEVLEDATGSVPYANWAGSASARQIHETFMIVLQSRFAAVLPSAEWAGLLESGGSPERDSIVGSNQRARAACLSGAAA